MSARTPFIPSGPAAPAGPRSVSRAANIKDSNATSAAPPHFAVDQSNPLHRDAPVAAHNSQNKSQSNPQQSNPEQITNRPLNVGGLIKKRPPQSTPQNPSSRRQSLTDNAMIRPGTADPYKPNHRLMNRDQNHSTSILAPSPRQLYRQPSPTFPGNDTSGTTFNNSSSAFKTPTLPASRPSSDIEPIKNAHIPTSALGLPLAIPRLVKDGSLPHSMISSGTAEPIETHADHGAPDHDGPSSFSKLPHTVQTGPQRILIIDDDETHSVEGDRSLRKINKRGRAEYDNDNDQEHWNERHTEQVKRYKFQETNDHQREYQCSPSPPDAEFASTARSHHHQSRLPPSPEQRQYPAPIPHQQSDTSSGLLKLFGLDASKLDDLMENYERLISKWKSCSDAEWLAGAEEIANKYAKLLDFVKAHMAAKMKLFAGIHSKVDTHNTKLDGNGNVLVAVKNRLISESGNVLGRGMKL